MHRSPSYFISKSAYSVPSSKTEAVRRLKENPNFFLTNYTMLMFIVFSFTMYVVHILRSSTLTPSVAHPWLLILAALLILGWTQVCKMLYARILYHRCISMTPSLLAL